MSEIQKPGFSSPYENLLSISTEEKTLSIPAAEKPLSIPAAENHYPFQLRHPSHPFPPQYTAAFPPFTLISRIPWKIRFAIIRNL